MKKAVLIVGLLLSAFFGGAMAQTIGGAISFAGNNSNFGTVFIRSALTFVNTLAAPIFYVSNDFSGTLTNGNGFYNAINANTDTVAAAGAGGGATNLYVGQNFGGATVTGNRTDLEANLYMTAKTGNGPGNAAYYTARGAQAQASDNDGGTNTVGAGNLFADNTVAILASGATWWNSITGAEDDIAIQSGASAYYKIGRKIVQLTTDSGSGSVEDVAFSFANQLGGTAPGWKNGISFGSRQGWWPIQSTGTIIGTQPAAGGGPGYSVLYGIDFSAVTFSAGGSPLVMPLLTPASSSATCKAGATEWDASFIYICTATNTWKRAALATF